MLVCTASVEALKRGRTQIGGLLMEEAVNKQIQDLNYWQVSQNN